MGNKGVDGDMGVKGMEGDMGDKVGRTKYDCEFGDGLLFIFSQGMKGQRGYEGIDGVPGGKGEKGDVGLIGDPGKIVMTLYLLIYEIEGFC